MTKSDLIDTIAAEAGISKAAAGKALAAFERAVSGSLAAGGEVQLVGFGTFYVGERAERRGRNPKTGEPLTIAASRAVKFKPGKALKNAVNG
jgi:DNA-binding protein HU-beta